MSLNIKINIEFNFNVIIVVWEIFFTIDKLYNFAIRKLNLNSQIYYR